MLKSSGGVDVIDGARALAEIFGTERIDFVIWEGEADVVVEDWGCGSCGYGSVIVIRGVLDGDSR